MAAVVLMLAQWRTLKASRAWKTSMMAFVMSGAGLAYATASETDMLTRLMRPTPPEVSEDVIVRNVRDEQGRRASFRILLLTDEYRWQLSSATALDSSIAEPEFTPEMKRVLSGAREIISIGASSEEIVPGLATDEGRVREEARAARRAQRIAEWLERAVSRPVSIRRLNVGHHVPTRGLEDTSDQRRVVIIVVLEREDSTNMDEALRAAMIRESMRAPVFESLLTRYSLTAGDTFTWVD